MEGDAASGAERDAAQRPFYTGMREGQASFPGGAVAQRAQQDPYPEETVQFLFFLKKK